MTKERAEEIRVSVWPPIWAKHYWTIDGRGRQRLVPAGVTLAEHEEILAYWDTLPGETCYYDAVARMARGDHLR